MQKLSLNDIREKYLSFFESKDHLRLKSAPLVPQNDASLLLINSGMAPLKPYFTGAEKPPKNRVTTCQKCIRTPDIERVGKTARHGTFFEMLGNFSFGDYFKHEATRWAWEFVTEVMDMPIDKLWVTIYQDDDEAYDIWTKEVGVSPDRIARMGKEDNFWEHGTGPCGPCSEIYFDRGVEKACSPDCVIGCDCDRYVEFWNLVFTQFDKDTQGNYHPLANPNIDTGMGLERLAAIMQGVDNLFEVDTVQNIMMHIRKIAGVEYKKDAKTDVSLRVITDHIRSTTMMICDGVIPSNEGRGYVLRRLLRRAARHGKLLGIEKPFLHEVCATVVNESKLAYPELVEKASYMQKIVKIEEERFVETIDNGLSILNEYIAKIKSENKNILDGESAFKLYDTYGFPLDLTLEIVEEQGMKVDEAGFNEQMQIQRKAARAARKDGSSWDNADGVTLSNVLPTEFLGYDALEASAKVVTILANKEEAGVLPNGSEGVIICDKTAFYGESGGQVGDVGIMVCGNAICEVVDTKKSNGIFMHHVKVTSGNFTVGDIVIQKVDKNIRLSTERNHSTTHLLQKALTEVLGSHVEQAGSFVSSERLRFDFSHFEAMTNEQIAKVEAIVNEKILEGLNIQTLVLPIDEARNLGATALFGEKYGDVVRVVKMDDYSIELCGGTHMKNTANAGLFKLLSETGVAAGVRRIEGTTGTGFLNYIHSRDNLISNVAHTLKTTQTELVNRAKNITEEMHDMQKTIEQMRSKLAKSAVDDVITSATDVNGVKVMTYRNDTMSADDLRTLCDFIKDKLDNAAIIASSVSDDKIAFVGIATKSAVGQKVHIGNIIKEITKLCGGNGGGKPDMAQGGGKDISKIDVALGAVVGIVEGQVGN